MKSSRPCSKRAPEPYAPAGSTKRHRSYNSFSTSTPKVPMHWSSPIGSRIRGTRRDEGRKPPKSSRPPKPRQRKSALPLSNRYEPRLRLLGPPGRRHPTRRWAVPIGPGSRSIYSATCRRGLSPSTRTTTRFSYSPFDLPRKGRLFLKKGTAGRLEAQQQISAGDTEFRIYVSSEGKETQIVNVPASLLGGETHVLRIIVAENGSTSAQLD